MPGLLDQNPQAAVDPANPAPEPVSPMAQDQAQDAGLGDEAATIFDEAINLMYSEENTPRLLDMFEQSDADSFPIAMAAATTKALGQVDEAQATPMSDELLAEVGVHIFETLSEDLTNSGVVPEVDQSVMGKAMEQTLRMWGKLHPDRFDEAAFEQAVGGQTPGQGESSAIPIDPQDPTNAQGLPEHPGAGLLQGVM